jgi:cell division transport system permease protein
MLSVATIFVMVLTISLVTSFFLLQGISNSLISSLEEKVDVSVYFKKDAPEEEITKIEDELLRIPEVKNIDYISRQQALDTFVEKHKDDAQMMESLKEIGENPFFASLNIKAWQANQYEAVSNFFENSTSKDILEKIDYFQRKPLIDKVFSISSFLKKFGIGAAIVLGILAVLVTFNTIKLAIFNHREEISVMRLVGASNWFIRGPFIVQGMISSLLSILITLVIFIPLSYFLSPKLTIIVPDFNLFAFLVSNFGTLLLLQILVGIGIGFFSSLIAIRRYLQV